MHQVMNRRTSVLTAVWVAGLGLVSSEPSRAQTGTPPTAPTPRIFTACYVPLSGTVYLVGEANTAADCVRASHLKFRWSGDALSAKPTSAAGDSGVLKLAAAGAPPPTAIKAGDAAGGDLAGTYPNPTVHGLQTRAVAPDAPAAGQVLTWNGTAWTPVTPASGTSDNVPNTLVQRDATGGFRAGPVTLGQLTVSGAASLAGQAQVNTDGGFVVGGSRFSGAIPATGAGTRLMWYPGKGAFRAGVVLGAQWDDPSVGGLSVAAGLNATASGPISTAIGDQVTASGPGSTAIGTETAASGNESTALGSHTTASGSFSTAMGANTTASGVTSVAMGSHTTASGDFSTAMGTHASTNQQTGAFVYGDNSVGDPVQATAPNQFVVRAAGGVRLFNSSSTAAFSFEGGSGTGCGLSNGALTCSGSIASASGGFKFPDGTVQTTAAAGGASGTSDNVPNTLVQRDANGGFAAGSVTLGGGQAQINTDGGFVVRGTSGLGVIPATGGGVRLMWYPGKAAFRAGEVPGFNWDDVNIGVQSVALGVNTRASGVASAAFGSLTTASGDHSFATGDQTTASGEFSTALGFQTRASGNSSTAMGAQTTASAVGSTALGGHTTASGGTSTAMGFQTSAQGDFSTAMGSYAASVNKGSFAYGDASIPSYVQAVEDNSFVVRASGGFRFRTSSDLSTGCDLPAGSGTFSCTSDRNRKENFRDEDREAVLGKIAGMSIQSWNFKGQSPSVRHLGPTAQDFYSAFALGEGETTISTVDADGVSLLAVQALEKRTAELREKVRELAALRAEHEELKTGQADLKQQVQTLRALLARLITSLPEAREP